MSAQRVPHFPEDWWRQFDKAEGAFVDETGFINRLPLRLTSNEMVIHGTCDAQKMWADFAHETKWTPVLVGGKAVVNLWLNNFLETDCGGSYRETWINCLVTAKEEPLSLPFESPLSLVVDDPKVRSYLMRVICGDTPGNPGAAMKAIVGGRGIFGFPKHPEVGQIDFSYGEKDGKQVSWNFECKHKGKLAVKANIVLPDVDPNCVTIPLDIKTPDDFVIGSPTLGGTHLGHNGAHQVQFGQAMCCTQKIGFWDANADSLTIGDADHYAPFGRWNFEPLLKAHIPDFKTAAFKPVNWIAGDDAMVSRLAKL